MKQRKKKIISWWGSFSVSGGAEATGK